VALADETFNFSPEIRNRLGVSALIASGLVLFVITLLVNLIARYVIYRSGVEERSAAV